jgi:hypothetical protein
MVTGIVIGMAIWNGMVMRMETGTRIGSKTDKKSEPPSVILQKKKLDGGCRMPG